MSFVFAIEASDQPGPPTPDPGNPISDSDDATEDGIYEVGGPIVYNPAKGPWVKEFVFVPNGAQVMEISEGLLVGATSPPIADWHEVITSGNAKWVPCPGGGTFPPIPPTASGPFGSVTGIITTTSSTDDTLWFDFSPVFPTEMFNIQKCFEYTASSISLVVVEQYPTIKKVSVGGEMFPVDTTALLLAATYSTASWMIPLMIAAVGFGILITHQKTKLKYNSCPSCKIETEDFFELGDKVVSKCDNPKCRVNLFFIRRYRNSFQ